MRFNGHCGKPPIVIMAVDTTNKTIEQLENEIHSSVFGTINYELAKIEGSVPNSIFKLIKADMIAEGNKMVSCFVSQLVDRVKVGITKEAVV